MAGRDKVWLVVLISLVSAQLAVSVFMPRGTALSIISDLLQGALLLLATAAFIPNIFRSQPASRARLFWILMSIGMFFWLAYQGMWNYFEVLRRQDVPPIFVGDVVLFLHLVPMIAALALRPHQGEEEHTARIGMLDFALLLSWWVFLYIYTVIPWQYVQVSEAAYSDNYNQLYLTEKLVLLLALLYLVCRARGGWRQLYGQFLAAMALYASSSYVANWAIGRNLYYSGSIYDIPLTMSVAWIAGVGHFARRHPLTESAEPSQPLLAVWITRLGMLAVFSLPWLALRSQLEAGSPLPVRKFRIVLCLLMLIVMGAMVFWRQRLLGAELSHLLEYSRRSFQDLQALQRQLIQSESLASLGRLLGGAAHEINNPLTAMLGYSELLSGSGLGPRERTLAAGIGEQVRRTKGLVASLLTFASQVPARKSSVDLNSIVHTALRLLEHQFEAQSIATHVELTSPLPLVVADSNQLLHVTLHLAGYTRHQQMREAGAIYVQTRKDGEMVVLEISDCPPLSQNMNWISPDGEAVNRPKSLSLSACSRIVQEHGGRILSWCGSDGSVAFRLELPISAQPAAPILSLEDSGGIPAALTSRS